MSWKSQPAIFGRLATEADVVSGLAIFHQAGGGEPYEERQLPARAIVGLDDGSRVKVTIVQLERNSAGFVVCGARADDQGDDLVCMLDEIEFLDGEE